MTTARMPGSISRSVIPGAARNAASAAGLPRVQILPTASYGRLLESAYFFHKASNFSVAA